MWCVKGFLVIFLFICLLYFVLLNIVGNLGKIDFFGFFFDKDYFMCLWKNCKLFCYLEFKRENGK